jgi:hypothetical protein
MKGDLGESFERLKERMFIRYKGCIITITSTCFIWNNEEYYYLDSAKAAIDASYVELKNSINNQNHLP